MNAQTTPLVDELSAALQWWQLAGVDCDFTDDATDWLGKDELASDSGNTPTAPQNPAASASPTLANNNAPPAKIVERAGLLSESPPSNLAEFHEWWLEAPGLDAIGPRGRVPARGPANAELMVLVIDPEQGDRDRLLSGPQGHLLTRMLFAMGFEEEQTYVASALPRHTPMADTAALAAGGMDQVVAHHIALAAPKRVIALGANIPPLLGHELTKDIQSLREINQKSSSVPLLVSEGLDSMMTMPRLKARFWRRWIEWSAR